MKNKLAIALGILGIAAMASCTVVYQNPSEGYASAPASNRAYAQNAPQQGQGTKSYNDDEDSLDNEPLIDFDNNAYSGGYVYNPYYYGSAFYAGNPFWGIGLYPGWSWGGYYDPWGWNIGIGYGWGGYFGWGSLYYGWGGSFGWPCYYGWGGGWGRPWGRGIYSNRPYFIDNRGYAGGFRGRSVYSSRENIAGLSRSATRNAGFVSASRNATRDMNVRGLNPNSRNSNTFRSFSNTNESSFRSMSPRTMQSSTNRGYNSTQQSTPSTRSYSAPVQSSRSFGGNSGGGGGFRGGGSSGGGGRSGGGFRGR